MSMNSLMADCIARLKNAIAVKKKKVTVFYSGLVLGLLQVLKDEGYIYDYKVVEPRPKIRMVEINLKFYNGGSVIQSLKMISKPGCRVYSNSRKMPKVYDGLGVLVLSTSKGLMSDAQARLENVGGEIICQVM